jgi:glycolate oxidase
MTAETPRILMPVAMPRSDDRVLARRAEIVVALKRIVPGEGVIDTERAMRP